MKWRKIRLYTKTQRLFSRKYQVLIEEVYLAFIIMNICSLFGSDRSPRRGNVCVSVRVIMLRMTLKEFLMHSKESRRVLSIMLACMIVDADL